MSKRKGEKNKRNRRIRRRVNNKRIGDEMRRAKNEELRNASQCDLFNPKGKYHILKIVYKLHYRFLIDNSLSVLLDNIKDISQRFDELYICNYELNFLIASRSGMTMYAEIDKLEYICEDPNIPVPHAQVIQKELRLSAASSPNDGDAFNTAKVICEREGIDLLNDIHAQAIEYLVLEVTNMDRIPNYSGIDFIGMNDKCEMNQIIDALSPAQGEGGDAQDKSKTPEFDNLKIQLSSNWITVSNVHNISPVEFSNALANIFYYISPAAMDQYIEFRISEVVNSDYSISAALNLRKTYDRFTSMMNLSDVHKTRKNGSGSNGIGKEETIEEKEFKKQRRRWDILGKQIDDLYDQSVKMYENKKLQNDIRFQSIMFIFATFSAFTPLYKLLEIVSDLKYADLAEGQRDVWYYILNIGGIIIIIVLIISLGVLGWRRLSKNIRD